MSLLVPRHHYKPFKYPWAFEYYHQQHKSHWLPEEVPLGEDVRDWAKNLTDAERHLLTQIFRFFTQADVDVASGYLDKYIPAFKHPELRMMLSTFASFEAIHIHAYSLLLDTIGMPEVEYKAFREYEEMQAKHDYMFSTSDVGNVPGSRAHVRQIARELAIFSAFGEGMQLFSSFAILLNFPRFGKMRGMGQIVTWSIRDESLHVEAMIKLFKTLVDESPWLWTDDFKASLYKVCRDMVDLEDKFIDLAFEQGGVEGLEKEEVKAYIRYIADRRLLQLGLKPNFGQSKNPLPWLDWVISGVEHSNFFETRATEYSKGSLTGEWSDVFA